MANRRDRPPMRERVARTSRPADPADCPARHCWVADPADRSVERRPGLLVEWRAAPGGGWQGRVVYVASMRAGRWCLVEEWVDEVLLTPS
jgi:hypothetical protein